MSVGYKYNKIILSQNEYNRIRHSISGISDYDNDEKEKLRELSKTRSARWTNTLIGNRQVKLVFIF